MKWDTETNKKTIKKKKNCMVEGGGGEKFVNGQYNGQLFCLLKHRITPVSLSSSVSLKNKNYSRIKPCFTKKQRITPVSRLSSPVSPCLITPVSSCFAVSDYSSIKAFKPCFAVSDHSSIMLRFAVSDTHVSRLSSPVSPCQITPV